MTKKELAAFVDQFIRGHKNEGRVDAAAKVLSLFN